MRWIAVPVEPHMVQALSAALERAGNSWASREQFQIGVAEIDHDWAAYQAGWSSNHRRHMRKSSARALGRGPSAERQGAAGDVDPGAAHR